MGYASILFEGLVFCDIFPNYSPLHFYLESSGEGEGEGNGVEAETNRRDNLTPEAPADGAMWE